VLTTERSSNSFNHTYRSEASTFATTASIQQLICMSAVLSSLQPLSSPTSTISRFARRRRTTIRSDAKESCCSTISNDDHARSAKVVLDHWLSGPVMNDHTFPRY